MTTLPIIFTTREDAELLNDLSTRIKTDKDDRQANILLNYPVVYIHYWKGRSISFTDRHGTLREYPRFNVYVGESNDILKRTKEHYSQSDNEDAWQYGLTHNPDTPQMVVIGHEHFNKSFTLDMENRLIEYIMSMTTVDRPLNGRGNPQNGYYPDVEFSEVFNRVWKQLVQYNPSLFLPKKQIEHSALFKASPLKKLTPEQLSAKETILAKIRAACTNRTAEPQLIFVQGEAGTGKTVLNSALFYDLIINSEEYFGRQLDCHMMVNHDQQLTVYKQLAERLSLGDDIVHKPTSFINKYTPDRKVDVSFIDEGHLLLTQGKQSYQGKNQLSDIMERSRVTVLMFDEYQVLTAEEYWEPAVLQTFKNLANHQHNTITLDRQLRMHCSEATSKWIEDFCLRGQLNPIPQDPDYVIKSFSTPAELYDAIREKARQEDSRLSRMVATYDWEYSDKNRPTDKPYWQVEIGDWSMPWNYETKQNLSRKELHAISHLAWAEQPHTINEVGSTFTIQGFDLSYVGVILGPSVKYRNGEVIFDPTASKSDKATRNRTLQNGTKQNFAPIFIRNEVKVLMSRGVNGLFIYACDDSLRAKLNELYSTEIG